MYHSMYGWGMGPWMGHFFGMFMMIAIIVAIAAFCFWRAGSFNKSVEKAVHPENPHQKQEDAIKLLLQLNELKEKGAISEEEYTLKKTQLLERI